MFQKASRFVCRLGGVQVAARSRSTTYYGYLTAETEIETSRPSGLPVSVVTRGHGSNLLEAWKLIRLVNGVVGKPNKS